MAAKADAKTSGKAGMIATMAALTALAGGGGVGVGKLLIARLRPVVAAPAAQASVQPSPYSGETEIKELPPILTNLADPARTEIRLQASIVYPKKAVENPAMLMAQIGDDLVAFLKTLSLEQVQGPSGLQNLREDLNERAAIRSQGLVREVIIETLVTQ